MVGYVFPQLINTVMEVRICIKRNIRSKKIVTLSQSLKFKFLVLKLIEHHQRSSIFVC